MKVAFALLVVLGTACARPEVAVERKFDFDGAPQQQIAPEYDTASLPLEARVQETNVNGVRTLSYYGGALGHYLVIEPSGQMYITGKRRVPQGRKDDEEDVGVAEEPSDGGNDSVAIKPPPENASVAEAKPVAVAIAGEGGVASAQPVGQAIVGPGGLAVSRPIATSIAGIPGAENLVLKPEKAPASRKTTGYIYSVYHSPAFVQPYVYHQPQPYIQHVQPIQPGVYLPNYYY